MSSFKVNDLVKLKSLDEIKKVKEEHDDLTTFVTVAINMLEQNSVGSDCIFKIVHLDYEDNTMLIRYETDFVWVSMFVVEPLTKGNVFKEFKTDELFLRYIEM